MNTEQLRAEFEAWAGYSEEALSRDAGDGYCIKGVDNEWRAWQAALASPEVQAVRVALEMIAGMRPCPDILMGNADIARAALAQNQGE